MLLVGLSLLGSPAECQVMSQNSGLPLDKFSSLQKNILIIISVYSLKDKRNEQLLRDKISSAVDSFRREELQRKPLLFIGNSPLNLRYQTLISVCAQHIRVSKTRALVKISRFCAYYHMVIACITVCAYHYWVIAQREIRLTQHYCVYLNVFFVECCRDLVL